MKMKRSEKLGMFTGLVVGVLLLLISVFMIFQTTCKVWGAEKPANATQQGIDVSSHQGKIDWGTGKEQCFGRLCDHPMWIWCKSNR